MNDTAKMAMGVGLGVLAGKLGSGFGWLIFAGSMIVFVANSQATQKAITSGAKKAYESVKR